MAIKRKAAKTIWKPILIAVIALLAVLVLVVGIYVLYVILSYKRIEDNQVLTVERATKTEEQKASVAVGEMYCAMTYNIGFGAYSDDYSFFMDGGKHSWALSEEAVYENIAGSIHLLDVFHPDFMLVQEIDVDSTRSYHIDQRTLFAEAFPGYDTVFAYNYFHSPFLMWPLYEPHGTITAGLGTFAKFPMQDAVRRSLPIMDNLNKYLDLDRCYTRTAVPVENGAYLCLYNVHLSAYGNDAELGEQQISMLLADMQADYDAGNYIICGGDFNHDLKLAENEEASETWAKPFPRSMLPAEFKMALDYLSEQRIATTINTARDSGKPYELTRTKTYMLDGFLISDNIEFVDLNTLNSGFEFSDHNPLILYFRLKEKQ